MSRRPFINGVVLGVFAAAVGSCFAWWSCSTPSGPSPNIVLINIDDQGYADLGCYGAPGVPDPQH